MKKVFLILVILAVMGLVSPANAAYFIAGDFNGWNAAGNLMTETSSGVWSVTLTGITAGTHEFKVTDGTWSVNYPSANSWFIADTSGSITITFNANSATDGWLPAQYRIGVSIVPTTWTIAGSFQGWNNANPATAMTSLGGGIYRYTQALSASPNPYQFKAVVTGTWDSISSDGRSVNTANMNLTLAADAIVDFYVNALSGTIGIGGDIDLSPYIDLAYDPNPKNGAVVGTGTTVLSWTNPDPNNPADTITADVYFLDAGTSPLSQDPNLGPILTDPGVVQIANDITDETLDLNDALVSVLPLQDDHYYYWAVHVTDPNTPGAGVTTQGDTWYFFTGDAAPVPGGPVDQYMWLSQDDSALEAEFGPGTAYNGPVGPNIRYFEVTASYTDDDKSPVVDANFVNLNWDYAKGELGILEVSDVHTAATKSVRAVYRTVYEEGGDPGETTVIPGLWNIRLEVTDGNGTARGETGYHRIVETCGQAAFEDPLDDFDGTYDANGDCIINLIDFADFAAAWLNQGIKYE